MESVSRKLIKDILGIDWSLLLRQEGLYGKDDHTGHIVYSLFLEDKIRIIGNTDRYKWIKLSEIDQMDDFHQNILKASLIKRF